MCHDIVCCVGLRTTTCHDIVCCVGLEDYYVS